MDRSRRFLPSLNLLSAFEAVLRTGSTAVAARELHLTQSTVSRSVQNLEAQLGRTLFVRHRRRLIPTPAAREYCGEITRALDLIKRSSMKLVSNPGGGVLSLATLPTLGTRWLAPRLSSFQLTYPGITVNFSTRLRRIDFASENFDAAIYFESDDLPRDGRMKLFDEQITACCACSFRNTHPITDIEDLKDLPLMQIETRTGAWDEWFRAQGTTPASVRGMMFDQFAPMIQAAIAGLGIALLPDYLAQPEIEGGRLVVLFQKAVPGTGAYWLAWPHDRANYPPLEAFRSWLSGLLDQPAFQ